MPSELDLFRLVADLGTSGVMGLVIVFVLRYLERRDQRSAAGDERQDTKDSAFITVIQALINNLNAQTTTLMAINAKMPLVDDINTALTGVHTLLTHADNTMSAITENRERRFDELTETVNAVPERVVELLKDDLQNMGNKLSEMTNTSRDFYADAKATLAEWASLTARVQRLFGTAAVRAEPDKTQDAGADQDSTDGTNNQEGKGDG